MKKCFFFLRRELTFVTKLLESTLLRPSWPDLQIKCRWKMVDMNLKQTLYLIKIYFQLNPRVILRGLVTFFQANQSVFWNNRWIVSPTKKCIKNTRNWFYEKCYNFETSECFIYKFSHNKFKPSIQIALNSPASIFWIDWETTRQKSFRLGRTKSGQVGPGRAVLGRVGPG